MPVTHMLALMVLASLSGSRAQFQCSQSCPNRPLTGFVRREGHILVEDQSSDPFRFVSMNIPNLHRIEVEGTGRVSIPTTDEITDALCSIQQMDGKVARIYSLSLGSGPAFHITGRQQFNETWFQVIDRILQVANRIGVRIIFPVINTFDRPLWGGVYTISQWADVEPYQFFYDSTTTAIYQEIITYLVTRVNSITGIMYRDDPAIFGWEMGNEMFVPPEYPEPGPIVPSNEEPPPLSWTASMSAFIKGLDPNHLVIDGGFPNNEGVLQLEAVDMVGGTYYNGIIPLMEDIEYAAGVRPLLIKEFAITTTVVGQGLTFVGLVLQKLLENNVTGALYWSLRFHTRDGGFYNHWEQSGISSLHWPGFNTGPPSYDSQVFQLLRTTTVLITNMTLNSSMPNNLTTIDVPLPMLPTPCAPTIAANSDDYFPPCMAFYGATGASFYKVWLSRSDVDMDTNSTQRWLITQSVQDTYSAGSSFWGMIPPQQLREMLVFIEPGPYQICMSACNPDGLCSDCSQVVPVTFNFDGPVSDQCPQVEGYKFWYDTPPPTAEVFWVLWGGVVAVGATLLLIALGSAYLVTDSRWLGLLWQRYWGAVGQSNPAYSDIHDEPVDNEEDDLRLHLVLSIKSRRCLQWLQVVAVVMYVMMSCATMLPSSGILHNIAAWGTISPTILILLFGFFLAADHGAVDRKPLTVGGTFWPVFAYLMPILVVSLFGGMFFNTADVWGVHFLDFVGLNAWVSFKDVLNGPSWIVSAILFNTLIFAPLYDMIGPSTVRNKAYMLAVGLVMTLWQTADGMDLQIFMIDRVVSCIFLRAHFATFWSGVLLGSLLHDDISGDTTEYANMDGPQVRSFTHRAVMTGVLIALLSILVGLFSLVDISAAPEMITTWAANGMMLPVLLVLVWLIACSPHLPPFPHAKGFTRLAIPTYIFHPLALMAAKYSQPVGTSGVWIAAWLIAFSVAGHFMLQVPARAFMSWGLEVYARREVVPAPPRTKMALWEQVVLYYAGLLSVFAFFAYYTWNSEWARLLNLTGTVFDSIMMVVSWVLIVPLPALIHGLLGLVLYPAPVTVQAPPVQEQLDTTWSSVEIPDFIVHVRIVTRGNNPNLVADNCRDATRVLNDSGLPKARWEVEVVTDNAMHLTAIPGLEHVKEIVVPTKYHPPGNCKYKARALHYAILKSTARRTDWIVHLDEETRFDCETVDHIVQHCAHESHLVLTGQQEYPKIGQGVIKYNQGPTIENNITALADAIRVSDDFGKFALQYRLCHLPLIGMHGSFVVCSNMVEMDVGFDYGMVGSITEDTYFAMKATTLGVRMQWIGGYMYEQSPFNIKDFCKQRSRWFSGLWLCALAKELPLWHRTFLATHLASWSFCPLLVVVTWCNLSTVFVHSTLFTVLTIFVFAIPFWGYLLGFLLNFRPGQFKHGTVEYLLMLAGQLLLIPLFSAMEAYGVFHSFIDRSTFKQFHIVQKESPSGSPRLSPVVSNTGSPLSSARNSEAGFRTNGPVPFQLTTPPSTRGGRSNSNVLGLQLEYWTNTIGVDPDPLDLTTDKPRPIDRTSRCTVASAPLPSDLDDALTAFAIRTGTTKPLVCLAAYQLLLNRLTRQDQVIVAYHTGTSSTTTFPAASTVLMKADFSSDTQTFPELCAQTLTTAKAVQMHSLHVRWDQILGALSTTLDPSRLPVAQAAFTCQDSLIKDLPDWHAQSYDDRASALPQDGGACRCEYEITLNFAIQQKGVVLSLVYNSDLFERQTAVRMMTCLATLLRGGVTEPSDAVQRPVGAFPMLQPSEAQHILSTLGGCTVLPALSPPDLANLRELFERQVARTPNNVCLEFHRKTLTYSAVHAAATRVANSSAMAAATRAGVTVMGISTMRCMSSIVGLVSIWMSNCCYVPINPDDPDERIRTIVADSGMGVFVCTEQCRARFTAPDLRLPIPIVVVNATDTTAATLFAVVKPPTGSPTPVNRANTENLSVMLFTSGSTGKPKGVMISHRMMMRFAHEFSAELALTDTDRVLGVAPMTFDLSVGDFCATFSSGATLVICTRNELLADMTELLRAGKITHMYCTPAHLGMVAKAKVPLLRSVVVAGEALPPALMLHWTAPGGSPCRLINAYGPTESNVVTVVTCSATMTHPTSIGKAIPGVKLYILDPHANVLPVGVPGELLIAGPQLAEGYLGDDTLTGSKFVTDPFESSGQGRMYKSGDLCKWLDDGTVEYLGRIDMQVKLNGFRIELGEIESVMMLYPGVKHAAANVVESSGSKRLVAYVVMHPGASFDQDAMRSHLKAAVPTYMVPHLFAQLDEMPLNPNGKIDRRKLPVVSQPQANGAASPLKSPTLTEAHGTVIAGADSFAQFLQQQGDKLQQQGVDSLGMVKLYHSMSSDAAMAEKEDAVLDNLRAVSMYGVIMDHYAGCSINRPCEVVVQNVLVPLAAHGYGQWTFMMDFLVRSIGNYKTMSSFVLASAYADSAGGADMVPSFGVKELLIFAVYLEMMWILDPISTLIANAMGEGREYRWWLGVHRWYLLQMLLCKLYVVMFHRLRAPAFVQVLISWVGVFVSPPVIGCISGLCTNRAPRSALDWSGLTWLDWFYTAFFRGVPNLGDEDVAGGGFEYVITRKYLILCAVYITGYHYLRPAVRAGMKGVDAIKNAVSLKSDLVEARVAKYFKPCIGLACALLVIAIAFSETVLVYGKEDIWLQEWGLSGLFQPHLIRLGGLVLALCLQTVLLSIALACTNRRWHLAGSTTLGTYVIHGYCDMFFAFLLPTVQRIGIHFGLPGAIVQLLYILAVPILVQLTVGPLYHWFLMWHLKLIGTLLYWLWCRASNLWSGAPLMKHSARNFQQKLLEDDEEEVEMV